MSSEIPLSAQDSENSGIEQPASKEADQNLVQEAVVSGDAGLSSSLDEKLIDDSNLSSAEDNVPKASIESSNDNEARLEQLEKEHETLRSQYMRIAADFDNFRKRQSRDHDDLRLQITCSTLSEILPIVDNFERARQQLDPQGEEAQALHRSYQGLYKQLVDVLKQLGVAPMRVVGQSFDPTLHEAVLREPSQEQPEDVVLEELQRGYHLNGRVLRHALVKVSMGPGPKGEILNKNDEPGSQEASINDEESSSREV